MCVSLFLFEVYTIIQLHGSTSIKISGFGYGLISNSGTSLWLTDHIQARILSDDGIIQSCQIHRTTGLQISDYFAQQAYFTVYMDNCDVMFASETAD